MDNYIKFKIMGGPKIIKSGVVPHIFDCQPDRKRAFSQPVREAALKRVKRQFLEDAASTSKSVLENNDDKRQCDPSFTNLVQSGPELNQSALPQKLNNASTQTHIKIRSKGIQFKFQRSVTVGLSPLKIHNKDAGTSPIKDLQIFEDTKSESGSSVFEEYSEYSGSDDCWYNESDSLSCDEDTKEEEAKQFKSLSLKCTVMKLQYRPRLYMGLPEYAFYTFQLMEKYCKTQTMHLFLTLKKIRTGQTFMSLGDDFGISESNASRIFAKSVPLLSKYLRSCIFNPQVSSVKLNLPLAFRARYSKEFCIIYCLEIEIEKPSDSVKQSLTWSEYKKCNTLKYLMLALLMGLLILYLLLSVEERRMQLFLNIVVF
ncbi:uncharacterized protein LOC126887783 [Diabrotica virgifera virgifera]|uniref:Transposase Helix-turn-helix domain-containing protein n=1 Tax=Diabrotica virgifera virgifera TaxID=50390 RepID=A0ABM5KMY5_DIAVI|nr:uncharacterized protein LOC126887783 [Diabrotica virgifera virgifera]